MGAGRPILTTYPGQFGGVRSKHMRHPPARIRAPPQSLAPGVTPERSDGALARLYEVEARSNPSLAT